MSSSPTPLNRRHFTRITTKLTVLYSVVLVFSSLVIFAVFYYSIGHTLEARDWRLLNQKTQEYMDRLNIKGLDDFRQYLAVDINHDSDSSLLVRILRPSGEDVFVHEALPPFQFQNSRRLRQALADRPTETTFVRLPLKNSTDYALALLTPLPNGNYLMVAKSTDGLASQLSHLRFLFGWAIFAVSLISSIGAFILANRAMEPVRELIRSVRRLESAALSERVSVELKDAELNELQAAFNHLLDKISRLVTSITEAFDHLAHDIRTPVTRLRGRAEIALNGVEDLEEYREALQSCYENSDRILKFMDSLTQITEAENRSINIKYELKSLGGMVREMMDLYEIAFEEKNIIVKQILIKNDKAYLDPSLIRRVIANLLDNAHKYTPEGGEVVIETYRTEKHVVLSIRDSGHGIPKQEQDLIWNRLYRGDKSRSEYGMGLGLTFVKAVVEAHGGVVNVISPVRDGHGTEFLIKFKHEGPTA